MSSQGPDQKYLVCIDFDETITQKHVHNFAFGQGYRPLKEEQVREPEFFTQCFEHGQLKHPDLMRMAIEQAIDNGHNVAITSYTAFPEVIPYFLDKMGLSQNIIAQIKIVGGFPTASGILDITAKGGIHAAHGKSLHIEQAKKDFGLMKDTPTILLDDSQNNIQIANRQDNTTGIFVPKVGSYYFDALLEKIGSPSLQANIAITKQLYEDLEEFNYSGTQVENQSARAILNACSGLKYQDDAISYESLKERAEQSCLNLAESVLEKVEETLPKPLRHRL